MKSIKHGIIFFTKTSRLHLCLLGTLNTNESRRNIKSCDDLCLTVNSEKNTPIRGILVIKGQLVLSSPAISMSLVFSLLHIHGHGHLRGNAHNLIFFSIFPPWCLLVGKLPSFNTFPSRQVLSLYFTSREKIRDDAHVDGKPAWDAVLSRSGPRKSLLLTVSPRRPFNARICILQLLCRGCLCPSLFSSDGKPFLIFSHPVSAKNVLFGLSQQNLIYKL